MAINQTESPHRYRSGDYNLKQVGDYFGLHYLTVSGIVKNHKSKT